MKKYAIIILLGSLLVSCDSFLEERPSKSSNVPLETFEQLDALIGNFENFIVEDNRSAVLCSEDWETNETLYKAFKSSPLQTMANLQVSTWDVTYCPYDGLELFWGYEYRKIFFANMVLNYIEKVTGDDDKKAELVAEAYLIKALSYWQLANTYCLPYTDATKNEPGVTIKNSVSFEENVGRATLGETYAEIERCLTEGLKLKGSLLKDGKVRAWRANTSAAKAFAARYYLSRNDYAKALDYATQALADYSELVDYNTGQSFYSTTVTVGGASLPVDYPATYRNTRTEMITYKEFYYCRLAYFSHAWYVPSARLMALYDQSTDLRYKYHFVENYSYTIDRTGTVSYPGYVFMGSYNIPSGPTTSEMILITAEALARTGNWQQGMQELEKLRVKRIDKNNYTALVATSQADAVKKILEERRRERPFVFTWLDYRRCNTNDVDYDDVSPSQVFYPYNSSAVLSSEALKTYTLSKGDRRWARPLPSTEIDASSGAIKQNVY